MKHFKFFILFTLIINLMLSGNLYSKKKEKLLKVGAVDLQKVFKKSPGKKIAKDHLEKKRKSFEDENKKREEKIKKAKKEYENNKSNLTDNEKESAQLEIKKQTIDLKEYVQVSNQKLEDEENKLLEPVIDDIKKAVEAVSMMYGYDIILDKSAYILYIDKEFDITDEVVTQLEGMYK